MDEWDMSASWVTGHLSEERAMRYGHTNDCEAGCQGGCHPEHSPRAKKLAKAWQKAVQARGEKTRAKLEEAH